MIQQWRIVLERSNGAVLVHDADEVAKVGIPEDGWRSCDAAGVCEHDETLRVTGEVHCIHKADTNNWYFSRTTPRHYQVLQHWTSFSGIS